MCSRVQLLCRIFLPSQYRQYVRHFSSPAIDRESLSLLQVFVKDHFNHQLTPSIISQLKQKSLAEDRRLTAVNFDANFLKACAEENNFLLAKQYLDHLHSSGQPVNNAVLNRYLLLCYRNPSKFRELEILTICKQLKSQSPVLDPSTAESLIVGLSITSQWRDAIDILASMEPYTTVKTLCLNAIIKAALQNHDLEVALRFMTRTAEAMKTIDDSVYRLWLEDTKYDTEQLIQFWSDHEILPMADTIKILQEKLTCSSGSAELVTIKADGTCPACKKKLSANRLSKSEFTQLRAAFLERVLQGKDVFRGSTPKELEFFRDFIAKNAPFDVVVDGLNVAYLNGKGGNKASQLVNLVKYLSNKRKVLILGKNHMLKWPAREMRVVREHAYFFTTDDLSKDDPFILYAALYSGPESYFLSRDQMRDHAFKLQDPALSHLFRKWQRARQLQITKVNARSFQIQHPPLHWPVAQKCTGNAWHIPYDNGEERYSYELPLTWLCAKVQKGK